MEKIPLYPFGFGLSFTEFYYSDIKLGSERFHRNEPVPITFKLKNIGNRDGSEIVQLYLKAKDMPFTTPLLTLMNFIRIELKAGESKSIDFELKPDDLLLFNNEGKEVFQPGKYEVIISGSAPIKQSVLLGAPKPASAEFELN